MKANGLLVEVTGIEKKGDWEEGVFKKKPKPQNPHLQSIVFLKH